MGKSVWKAIRPGGTMDFATRAVKKRLKTEDRNRRYVRDKLGWGDDGQTDADRRAMIDALRGGGDRGNYWRGYTGRRSYNTPAGYQRPPMRYVDPKTGNEFQGGVRPAPTGGAARFGEMNPNPGAGPRFSPPVKPPEGRRIPGPVRLPGTKMPGPVKPPDGRRIPGPVRPPAQPMPNREIAMANALRRP